MDEAMNAFVERQNIVHYIELLKTETDTAKRTTVVRLLAEEAAKQKKKRSA
jgi:hypothetical protein